MGVLSQEPCGPPCFHGMRPGVTTMEEAPPSLEDACFPLELEVASAAGGMQELRCNGGNGRAFVSGRPGETVFEIIVAPAAVITLGEMVARYGPPDSIQPVSLSNASADRKTWTWYWLLGYDRLQTLVNVIPPHQPGGAYTFGPETIIHDFWYETADYYQLRANGQEPVQPWKGYGVYEPAPTP